MQTFIFFGVLIAVCFGVELYMDNPNVERNHEINRLVKASIRRQRKRENLPKRGYRYVRAGTKGGTQWNYSRSSGKRCA